MMRCPKPARLPSAMMPMYAGAPMLCWRADIIIAAEAYDDIRCRPPPTAFRPPRQPHRFH